MTHRAGEALTEPSGTVHAVKTAGAANGVELATYVVEEGKPLLAPAE